MGEPDAILEYDASNIRLSLAKAVHVYLEDDGWVADVVFTRGMVSMIIQTPNEALRDEAIQHAKALLRDARTLENEWNIRS